MSKSIPESDELEPMSQMVLDDIIRKHKMFLKGTNGGARAIVKYRDLSGLAFSGQDLSQADFTGSDLSGADLSHGIFSSTNFFACNMSNADMRKGIFKRADFRGAFVAGADLTGADMTEADLRRGKIMQRSHKGTLEDRVRKEGGGAQTVFTGAKLKNTSMRNVQALGADFSDADLSNVNFNNSNLEDVSMTGANLTDSDFTGADLTSASLRNAIAAGTRLAGIEKKHMDMAGMITDRDMGLTLASLDQDLPELLQEHSAWVLNAGKKGRALDLSGYDLRDVLDLKAFSFTAIVAIGTNFIGQDLRHAEMQSGCFDRSDFRDCKMNHADLRGSTFREAVMSRVILNGAQLCPLEFKSKNGTRLKKTDMSSANLRFGRISDADLRDCIFQNADLTHTVFKNCDMRRADLTNATLKGAVFENVRLEDAIIDWTGV